MAEPHWLLPTAAEICRLFELREESPPPEREAPAAYLERLAAAGAWTDALRVIAYGLPKREAIWWGCICYRLARPEALGDEKALRVVVDWVLAPDDKLRREAELLIETDTVPGCLALAVFYSGGSIAPPDLPEVPPHPQASARAVAGGAVIASTLRGPDATTNLRRQFVTAGLEVALGQHLWVGAANH